jgi:predicted transcriptional regulator
MKFLPDPRGVREQQRKLLREDAIAAWNHYQSTGLHINSQEADRWLARLESGEDTEAPECHN